MKEFKKFERLLNEYSELKDKLIGTELEVLFDQCFYDVSGFNMVDEDEIISFLPELEKQVKSMRLLVKGIEMFDVTFA
jgi:hypothetical protein